MLKGKLGKVEQIQAEELHIKLDFQEKGTERELPSKIVQIPFKAQNFRIQGTSGVNLITEHAAKRMEKQAQRESLDICLACDYPSKDVVDRICPECYICPPSTSQSEDETSIEVAQPTTPKRSVVEEVTTASTTESSPTAASSRQSGQSGQSGIAVSITEVEKLADPAATETAKLKARPAATVTMEEETAFALEYLYPLLEKRVDAYSEKEAAEFCYKIFKGCSNLPVEVSWPKHWLIDNVEYLKRSALNHMTEQCWEKYPRVAKAHEWIVSKANLAEAKQDFTAISASLYNEFLEKKGNGGAVTEVKELF